MNVALRNRLMEQYPLQISASGLIFNRNIHDRLLFAYAVSPLKTARAFRQVGIDVNNPSDLATIARLSESGNDRRGVKMSDGKVYAFDTEKIVQKILSSHEPEAASMANTANIKWLP